MTIENLQTAINKLNYEGIDFAKLKLSADAFLDAIAKRIEQQKAQKKKAEAKAKAKAKKEADVKEMLPPPPSLTTDSMHMP